MRQIVLDTETTGLEPSQGHRIIEIGCVELIDRRATGNHYHQYLQPDREIDAGALEVHGITNEFLRDKPRFSDIVDDFAAYIKGAELIIHNAPFDIGFLEHEYHYVNKKKKLLDQCKVVDTLVLARRLHPGQKNSLDALCKRYAIDNSQRALHGALLDAEILADVYLTMTGGQSKLLLETSVRSTKELKQGDKKQAGLRVPTIVIKASDNELQEHHKYLSYIDSQCDSEKSLWRMQESE